MYIPVRSAGGRLAYKMPSIPMNAPAHRAVGPLYIQIFHVRRRGIVETQRYGKNGRICAGNQIHIHPLIPSGTITHGFVRR